MKLSEAEIQLINDSIKPIGLHGCSCHPFENWEECKRMHNQVFQLGDKVKQRHTGMTGIIFRIYTAQCEKGYVVVKYNDGKFPSDQTLEHVANLILINE
jgi:hypothetical protein